MFVYVRVEPLYEHVPFAMLQERVQLSEPDCVDVVFATDVQFVVQLHAFPDFVYPVSHVMLIVPPVHVPVDVRFQFEQPVHVSPADEHPPPVYLPSHVSLYVRVEPLYEHVPLLMLQERVQLSLPSRVDVVFATAVQLVLQVCVFIEHVHDELDLLQPPYPEQPVHLPVPTVVPPAPPVK